MNGWASERQRRPTMRLSIQALIVGPALFCTAACSGNHSEWISGTRMTVHWEHMKDAAERCHDIDPSESTPVQACRKVDGTDCYVYTGERANNRMFGELV